MRSLRRNPLSLGRGRCQPGDGDWMFTQLLETEQIGIPVFLGRHIGFRPTRPGEVGKRFPGVPFKKHEGMICRGHGRCMFAGQRNQTGCNSAR